MAHPNKAEGIRGHNAKLKRMTRDYGAASPAMSREARVNFPKYDGAEEDPGFGSDSAGATPRSDRPAARAAPGNAVATLKHGGRANAKAKTRRYRQMGGAMAGGGNSSEARVNQLMAANQQAANRAQQQSPQQNKAQGPGLIRGLMGSGVAGGDNPGSKRGGRIKHRAAGGGLLPGGGKSKKGKGHTNVSININPTGSGNTPLTPPAPMPMAAGAPPAPMPPRPPMPPPGLGGSPGMGAMPPGAGGPPPGMPPGGPPGMPPGPLGQLALQQRAAGLLPRKRGGRIPHDDEAADKKLVKDMVRQSALKSDRARGGSVLKGKGAESGEGRLNRNRSMGHPKRARGGAILKGAGAESGEGRLARNRHMDHKLKPTVGVEG